MTQPKSYTWSTVAAISVALLLASVEADAQGLTVSVTVGSTTTTISAARIQIQSSRGYAIGSSFQDFGGFHVTDAVVPPEGIELRPVLVKWDEIKAVEFLD